jgi:hypothetical protein
MQNVQALLQYLNYCTTSNDYINLHKFTLLGIRTTPRPRKINEIIGEMLNADVWIGDTKEDGDDPHRKHSGRRHHENSKKLSLIRSFIDVPFP